MKLREIYKHMDDAANQLGELRAKVIAAADELPATQENKKERQTLVDLADALDQACCLLAEA